MTQLISAIGRAIQPPLIKPVNTATATLTQEAHSSNQIRFIGYW
ncbi:hypothetical protein [Chroococcidiopsis sp. TS-821]|nr:hypothetical protein [Chroococcidiopsis sp. TS-821]